MIFRPRDRRILVLQGDRCCWSLWRGNKCVEQRELTIPCSKGEEDADTDDALDPFACPWPAEGECIIDVVVDSPLDDIDHVVARDDHADGHAAPALGVLRRHWLAMSLRRRYPDAAVRIMKTSDSAILASVIRAEIPSAWCRKLVEMQTDSVIVRRLHSALRLRRTDRKRGHALQVVTSRDTERHTLFLDGCPVFTRHVDVAGADERDRALAETCAHVAEQHAIVDPCIDRIDDDDGLGLASLALNRRHEQLAGKIVERQRTRHENGRLRLLTGLTTAIAGVAVTTALVHGVESARERARAIAAQEVAKARVEMLRHQVDARHATPSKAIASLTLIDAQRAKAGPAPDEVLRRLADVLTLHPDIAVERIAWNSGSRFDTSAGKTVERIRSPAALSLLSLDPRTLTGGGTDGSPLARGFIALEMSGRVVIDAQSAAAQAVDGIPVTPVGDQQKRFAAFLDALETRITPDGLVVDLSPAMAASRGQGGDRTRGADYAVRLRFATAG